MPSPRALVTGITGQDGSYLAEHLLREGYEVHGLVRRSVEAAPGCLRFLSAGDRGALRLHRGDLSDVEALGGLIRRVDPDEVYNLAAMSAVGDSFRDPLTACDVGAMGSLRLLEAVRRHRDATARDVRVFQASSSEIFGTVAEVPQTVTTPFHPRSPYGCAKTFAHSVAINYREAYGLHACSGILFNHESPRRADSFVTRKITKAVARIREGLQDRLTVGNTAVRRDWGFAGDYVVAMHAMLARDEPDDFVVATGATHSVQDFLETAFARVGLDPADHVVVDRSLYRPAEIDETVGETARTTRELGWEPRVGFGELVAMMVDADLELAAGERAVRTA